MRMFTLISNGVGKMTMIVLADEDEAFCENALALLKIHNQTAEAHSQPETLLKSLKSLTSFVAAISLQWSSVKGLDLIRLVANQPKAIAVFATGIDVSMREAVDAMQCGAVDVLKKPYSIEPLVLAATKDHPILTNGKGNSSHSSSVAGLTGREREVLDLLLEGKAVKAIGKHLSISSRTVEVHRRSIFKKTGVTSHATLISKLKS